VVVVGRETVRVRSYWHKSKRGNKLEDTMVIKLCPIAKMLTMRSKKNSSLKRTDDREPSEESSGRSKDTTANFPKV